MTMRMSWKVAASLAGAALLALSNVTVVDQKKLRRETSLAYIKGLEDDPNASPSMDTTTRTKIRPVINTFFQRIDPSKKGTGMSDEADQAMLDLWSDAWRAAGWEPRILDLSDAKKHPNYDKYSTDLEAVPMHGQSGKGTNKVYNQLCFLRWLAMAAAGGGFMCDYDVLPLRHADDVDTTGELPEGGAFTVYSALMAWYGPYAGTPAFMSGSAEEWDRMANAILANGLQHPSKPLWTDMFALRDLPGYLLRDEVVEPPRAYSETGGCKKIEWKRAVHFSHEAIGRMLKEGETMEDRPSIIRNFMNKWSVDCVHRKKNSIGLTSTRGGRA